MKPKEQRIAIAKACGWKVRKNAHLAKPQGGEWQYMDEIPDYLNDLNAMHEAEKWLIEDDQHAYGCYCIDLQEEYGNTVHLTASQRAEAFLKTLNLWKHEQ
jgi:hypothetical protein